MFPILCQDWVCAHRGMTFPGQDWVCAHRGMTFPGQDWVCAHRGITFLGQDWVCSYRGMTFLGRILERYAPKFAIVLKKSYLCTMLNNLILIRYDKGNWICEGINHTTEL